MHGNYLGGLMADPSTAALDPIFWSFHAYIDLLFLQWQQTPNHTVTTDPGFKMCIPKDPDKHVPFNVTHGKRHVFIGIFGVSRCASPKIPINTCRLPWVTF